MRCSSQAWEGVSPCFGATKFRRWFRGLTTGWGAISTRGRVVAGQAYLHPHAMRQDIGDPHLAAHQLDDLGRHGGGQPQITLGHQGLADGQDVKEPGQLLLRHAIPIGFDHQGNIIGVEVQPEH